MLSEFKSVLQSTTKKSSVHIFQYSVREDCEKLWAQLEIERGEIPWSTVLILYDGQCDRTVADFHPEDWLTPWDWAIAIAVLLGKEPARIPPAGFRCLIIDLLPSEWGKTGRMRFRTVGGLVPWVQWYRPLSKPRLLVRDFCVLFADLNNIGAMPRLGPSFLPESDLEMLSRTWAALLGAPQDRHAIGNFIGPLILAEGLKRRRGLLIPVAQGWVEKRFDSLIRTIGLRSKNAAGVTGPERPLLKSGEPTNFEFRKDVFHCCRRVRIALVDDQYKLGYHKIVSHFLFGPGVGEKESDGWLETSVIDRDRDVALRSIGGPGPLLRMIREAFGMQESWTRPHTFGKEDLDILLLDLRLFGDSSTDAPSENEKSFLRELLELVDKLRLPLNDCEELGTALGAARRRSNGGKEELPYLTLLPLLINRLDPSLPIVLFSSTHQREVVDAFREHPSIITTFSKPAVSGYSFEDLDSQCAANLENSLIKALELHRIRIVWKTICSLSEIIPDKGEHIQENRLEPRENGTPLFRLDPEVMRLLEEEFKNLFLHGRFADALQLPGNLIEYLGAMFEPPRTLKYLDIIEVSDSRMPGEGWIPTIESRLGEQETHPNTADLLVASVELLGREETKRSNRVGDSVVSMGKKLRKYLSDGNQEISSFDLRDWTVEDAIVGAYGSIVAALEKALNLKLKRAEEQLHRLANEMDSVAAYQFYALLTAMRNGRSHFRCRPVEHDESLEICASWVWMFFLRGLQLLLRKVPPLSAKNVPNINGLRTAVVNRWLPTTNFVDAAEGSQFCEDVIARFGQLIRLGWIESHQELNLLSEYALDLAEQSQTADPRT